jgi:hypothetical protein
MVQYNEKYLQYCPEIEFIQKIEIPDDKIDEISKYIKTNIFTSANELRMYIISILNVINKANKPNTEDIKNYLNETYTITTDAQDKIQFIDILDKLRDDIKIDAEYYAIIKRKLPYILKEIGLQKKRYSGGMYWYGLKCNNTHVIKPMESSKYTKTEDAFSTKIFDEKLQELINRRNTCEHPVILCDNK